MSVEAGEDHSDGVRSYVWDARNRLSAITGVASFAYDGLDRRSTATRGGTATNFLYDGWDVVQERQGGAVSADLLTGLEMDQRFSRKGLTVLSDQISSTLALVSGGAIQTRYGYDPYGAGAQVTGTGSDSPFQYTDREADGTGLLHYRNRFYHPAWGRFVSEDPLGLGGGDVNLYRYAANNPVQLNDPTGLVVSPPNKPSLPPPLVDNVAGADDKQGLKVAKSACNAAGLDRAQRRKFHDYITGQGIADHQELLQIAKDIKNGCD